MCSNALHATAIVRCHPRPCPATSALPPARWPGRERPLKERSIVQMNKRATKRMHLTPRRGSMFDVTAIDVPAGSTTSLESQFVIAMAEA